MKFTRKEKHDIHQVLKGVREMTISVIEGADRIEQILTHVPLRSGGEPTDNWISVKARLPEIKDHIDYACSDNVFTICDGFLCVMAYCKVNGAPVWCNCYGDIAGDPLNDDDYFPTYWQPLPKTK